MKKINESRINNLQNYIKDYHASHGVCPTYRIIKEELKYSSLSLVHSDIDRLKERGFLVDDEFAHLKLVSQKEEYTRKFDYPFLIMSSASNQVELLNEEEKKLLDAQDNYLKGNYLLAEQLSKELINNTKEASILFGAKLTLCWSAICSGHVDYWRDFFKMMISYQTQSISEKMEKEMIAHFLTSIINAQDNCPKWLEEGRFYELRNDAYPLACLLYFPRVINKDKTMSPYYLEPLCSIAAINHIDIIQVYLDIYLAIMYRYSESEEYLNAHLNAAIKTCLKHQWLIPLAEVRKTLGSVMYPILEEYEEGITKKIDDLVKQLSVGYDKICKALVVENPTKHLTFREVEIINYVHMNYSNKEIADKLYLSPETVKYYLSSLYLKLNVSGRKELQELVKSYV